MGWCWSVLGVWFWCVAGEWVMGKGRRAYGMIMFCNVCDVEGVFVVQGEGEVDIDDATLWGRQL